MEKICSAAQNAKNHIHFIMVFIIILTYLTSEDLDRLQGTFLLHICCNKKIYILHRVHDCAK
mgnify:CR=1 FL=1